MWVKCSDEVLITLSMGICPITVDSLHCILSGSLPLTVSFVSFFRSVCLKCSDVEGLITLIMGICPITVDSLHCILSGLIAAYGKLCKFFQICVSKVQ